MTIGANGYVYVDHVLGRMYWVPTSLGVSATTTIIRP